MVLYFVESKKANKMNFYIGEYYQYTNSKQKFKLKEKRFSVFVFECGHCCTDNVFLDLIRVKTNQLVSEDLQLKLNF